VATPTIQRRPTTTQHPTEPAQHIISTATKNNASIRKSGNNNNTLLLNTYSISTMKSSFTITAFLLTSVSAFAPSAPTRTMSVMSQGPQTILFAEPKEEEDGLDLNLEEMFDM
jgi:hypothetical protein